MYPLEQGGQISSFSKWDAEEDNCKKREPKIVLTS